MSRHGRTAKVQAAVEARVLSDRCLVPGCNDPTAARGLCNKHRLRLWHDLKAQPSESARKATEASIVRRGLSLMPGEARRIKRLAASPFAAGNQGAAP